MHFQTPFGKCVLKFRQKKKIDCFVQFESFAIPMSGSNVLHSAPPPFFFTPPLYIHVLVALKQLPRFLIHHTTTKRKVSGPQRVVYFAILILNLELHSPQDVVFPCSPFF